MTVALRVVLLYFFCVNLSSETTSPRIPDHLWDCYRDGGVTITSPDNVQVLVEILSKIERNNNNYNIRTISSSLLHRLRLDGVEKARNVVENENVIPFRASSFQFHKYSFLLDLLIPGENNIDLSDKMSLNDICTLHFLFSSTIDQWERGDESKVCPMRTENFVKNPPYSQLSINRTSKIMGISRCPIEKGVMQTPWGDVSAGTLLSGISAALEPQNVLLPDILNAMEKRADEEDEESEWDIELKEFFNADYKDETSRALMTSDKYISNILAATLSGDLAEVIVRQGPYVSNNLQSFVYGSWTRWNDSILPRDMYLMQESPYNWEMTNAEIVGGIDGFIIASNINGWLSKIRNTRLSQVIEMYYSNYGIAYDPTIRACNRKRNFEKLLDNSDIQEQTLNMVNFLWLRTGTVYATQKEVERLTKLALIKFNAYWPKLLDTLPGCNIVEDTNPMEIVIITDGAWTKYQTLQFMSKLAENVDQSHYGSKLGLIHGSTGEWISYPTHSMLELFDSIENYTEIWTSRLDYPVVLTTIINHLENVSLEEAKEYKVIGLPRVYTVIAPTTKFSRNELNESVQIMSSLRSNYMDVYFAYYTIDEEAFKELSIDPRVYSDMLIKSDVIDVEKVAEGIRQNFVDKIIPKRFLPPPCKNSRADNLRHMYEDYINMGEKVIYRIHPNYMMHSEVINVQFQGSDQGVITVCFSRKHTEEAAHTCKIVFGQYDGNFQIIKPCDGATFCQPIYFIVQARNATIKCSDRDCRFPDQIRYVIRHEGLQCMNQDNGSLNLTFSYKNIIVLLLLLNFYNIFYIN